MKSCINAPQQLPITGLASGAGAALCTSYTKPAADNSIACRSASDYINGVFYAAIAYDTSGIQVQNGCLPTMRVRRATVK